MDGMNGKAGVFAAAALAAIAVMLAYAATPHGNVVLAHESLLLEALYGPLIAAALGGIGGFLVYNCRPKAAIFLGDSGSHFLGFLLAALSFLGCNALIAPGPSLAAFCVLLMPFLYDVAYTLIKRFREGKTVWKAHREHLYQRLMQLGHSHMRVLGHCAVTYVVCGGLAIAAAASDSIVVLATCVIASLAVMIAYTAYVYRAERNPAAQRAVRGDAWPR
jgi:UDP-N-acetylmuramyl pentapeptide phosphotransferase/UDP-N-acetylglucosamine-1-phosphate transferase